MITTEDTKNTSRRWNSGRCPPPVGCITSDWRWTPQIGDLTSKQRSHHQVEVLTLIAGYHLQSELSPLSFNLTSNQNYHLAFNKRGDWDTHMGPHRCAHVCMQLCKRSGADMSSHEDMHQCIGIYTHSNQARGPGES